MTEELIRSARELTGTQKLAELRSRPPDREVVLRLVEAYVLWAKSFHEPPSKPSNSLRPIVAPVTGMAQVDEVNFALKALMVTESVAISITDTLSYMGRLPRLLVLLEDYIESGLVVIVPEARPGQGAGYWESHFKLVDRASGFVERQTAGGSDRSLDHGPTGVRDGDGLGSLFYVSRPDRLGLTK